MGHFFSKGNKGGPNNISCAEYPDATSHTPTEDAGKHSDTRVNLVLVGMSGSGKSASGNTILGRPSFTSRVSSHPVTTECHWTDTVIRGRPVRVIDTPDIFDEEINPTVKNQHVKKCRELCQVGPSVFLLVMHVSRFTDAERDVLRKMEEAFGSRVHEQTIILFTREDDLKQGEMSFENFLDSSIADLKKIIKKCGNRCVLFENKASCPQQVERLMQTVDQMLKQ
uniref:GTPase IMAP family member 8 n=1 Tax=Anoplopoma fimbria TaxID=229290 RepID=C3KJ12_ANOFI|nr:GTPase IMAP family member 7 [Anoplopoma fimbria]